MCHVNEKISNLHHREAIMQLLMGLNDSFSYIRGQILLMDPIPSIDKVHSLLVQDERQRSVGYSNNGPFVKSTTLAAKTMNLGSSSKTFKKGKERRGLLAAIVDCLVILWKNATKFMDILLDIRLRQGQGQIRSLLLILFKSLLQHQLHSIFLSQWSVPKTACHDWRV